MVDFLLILSYNLIRYFSFCRDSFHLRSYGASVDRQLVPACR